MKEQYYRPTMREAKLEALRENGFNNLLNFAKEKLSIDRDYLTTFLKDKGYDINSDKIIWKYALLEGDLIRITVYAGGYTVDQTFTIGREKVRVLDKDTRTMKEIYIPVAHKRPSSKIPIRRAGSIGYGPDDFGGKFGDHIADKD